MRCSWRAIWTNNVSKKLSLSIYIQFVTCTLQIFKWYDIVPNKILLLFNSYDDKGGFLISKVRGAMPMNHEFPSASKLDSYMIWFWSIPPLWSVAAVSDANQSDSTTDPFASCGYQIIFAHCAGITSFFQVTHNFFFCQF